MFRDILQLDQDDLMIYMLNHLLENGYTDVVYEDDFLYATGDIPIMMLAHLDTVHKEAPSLIVHDAKQNIFWSPQGIGGDDRCGVFGIAKLTQKYKPHVLLLKDEEVGGLGATAASKVIFNPDVKFLIEMDRRGYDDAVFYDCGNKEFIDYITSFGFQEQWGSFSDISVVAPIWDLAAVNLSSGYYREHTTTEYICLNETLETVSKIEQIFHDVENAPTFDFQETFAYKYYSKQAWGSYYSSANGYTTSYLSDVRTYGGKTDVPIAGEDDWEASFNAKWDQWLKDGTIPETWADDEDLKKRIKGNTKSENDETDPYVW